MTQVYRELFVTSYENGTYSVQEVWRGYPESYKPKEIPPQTMRIFEMFFTGTGWVRVDQPKFTTSLGSTNPQQGEME